MHESFPKCLEQKYLTGEKIPHQSQHQKGTPVTITVLAVQTEALGARLCKRTCRPHEHATA